MTTMKQKVGDAIYDAIRAGNWTSATLADAALATLETPDEGMVEAGAKVFGSHFAGAETARATFGTMIRHARKDGE